MHLNKSEVCELSTHPSLRGPVTMAFHDPTGNVLVCGQYNNVKYKECFSFDGTIWEPLSPLQEDHSTVAYYTESFFLNGIGLWVGGDNSEDEMVNEVLNSDGHWITIPVSSPYEFNLYQSPCTVKLNNTHIFFSGGYYKDYLVDTWILDLENLAWSPSTPMLTRRAEHGCVLTDTGEVLVAGGNGVSSVQIFNPVTMEWRENGDLSSKIETRYPGLLLWKKKVILVERYTDSIWMMTEGQEWQLMDVTMGAEFDASSDNAVLVSERWTELC